MKEITCCFTGHRAIPIKNMEELACKLESQIIGLIEDGYRFFGAGGALGFDTVAAQTVIHLRDKYPHIRLILVLPCETQAKSWSKDDQAIYEGIKGKADKVVYTSQAYYRGCMHKRNRHLVDNSSVCICYLNSASGGTAYTVDYARKNGRRIINIADLISN